MSIIHGVGGKKIWLETDHKVVKFLDWLPAGKRRPKAIIRFIARDGGTRTVEADDLTVLR
jgi:hypothetical protein